METTKRAVVLELVLFFVVILLGCIETEKKSEIIPFVETTTSTLAIPETSTTTVEISTTTTSFIEEATPTTTTIITTTTTTTTILKEEKPEMLWKYETDGEVIKALVSDDGESIIAGARGGSLYLFDKNGEMKWNKKLGSGLLNVKIDSNAENILAGFNSSREKSKLYLFSRRGRILVDKYSFGTQGVRTHVDACGEKFDMKSDGVYFGGTCPRFVYRANVSGKGLFLGCIFFEYDSKDSFDLDVTYVDKINYILTGSKGTDRVYLLNIHPYGDTCQDWIFLDYKAKCDLKVFDTDEKASKIAIGCREGNIYVVNEDKKVLWDFKAGRGVSSLTFTPDGKYLIAGSKDKKAYLFGEKGKLIWSYETNWDVNDVDISLDGKIAIVGSRDKYVYILDGEGELMEKFETGGEIIDVSMTPNGKYAVAGSSDKNIYFYKIGV
jgi:WD40 repeat protein